MKKLFFAATLLVLSGVATAGTGLNCFDENVLSDDAYLDICYTQSNDSLNGAYKELQKRHKGAKPKLDALKKMQLGWIQMRDNECAFRALNSAGGGGAARTEMRCVVELTLKRDAELLEM